MSHSLVDSVIPKGILSKINNEWTIECIYIHDNNFILNQKKLPKPIIDFICECLNISAIEFDQEYTLGFSNVYNRLKIAIYKTTKGVFVNGFEFKMFIYVQFIDYDTYQLIIKQFRDAIYEIVGETSFQLDLNE